MKSVLIILGMCLGAVAVILVISAIVNANQDPPVCRDLAGATDITAIANVIDQVAPGHDYAANELRAESAVRADCPDQQWKLDRYREQVLNPVIGGG